MARSGVAAVTLDPLARWEEIRQIGTACDWPHIGASSVRVYLSDHPLQRKLLFDHSDEAIAHGLAEWRRRLPRMRDPEKAVRGMLDWCDKFQLSLLAPVKGPVGCEFCDDGEIAYTAHLGQTYPIRPVWSYMAAATPSDRVAVVGSADGYDMVAPCPECNGGTWPIPRPPAPNGGEYREGFRPHEIEELAPSLCTPGNPWRALVERLRAAKENDAP